MRVDVMPASPGSHSEDKFIAGQWHNLRVALKNAFLLTIWLRFASLR